MVIIVTTEASAVGYGTELIYLLFLYVLFSAFSVQTNSLPVYVSNSPQHVGPLSWLSLFLVKRTVLLSFWN